MDATIKTSVIILTGILLTGCPESPTSPKRYNHSDSLSVRVDLLPDLKEQIRPNSKDDQAFTDEDTVVHIDVLENDADLNKEDSLRVMYPLLKGPEKGTASIDPTSDQLVYEPFADLTGSDQLTYVVSDGSLTDTSLVEIKIRSVNDSPTLVFLEAEGVELGADSSATVTIFGELLPKIQLRVGPGAENEADQTLDVAVELDGDNSSNPDLFAEKPEIVSSDEDPSIHVLSYTLAEDASGEAILIVTANDGQEENNAVSREIRMVVEASEELDDDDDADE